MFICYITHINAKELCSAVTLIKAINTNITLSPDLNPSHLYEHCQCVCVLFSKIQNKLHKVICTVSEPGHVLLEGEERKRKMTAQSQSASF